MGVNFDKISNDKPVGAKVPNGRHLCQVTSVSLGPAKSSGREQLTVTLTSPKGSFKTFLQDHDDEFVLYKLKRFTTAVGLNLSGDVSLKDISKLIMNKYLEVDTIINDSGYVSVDFSGNKEGYYVPEQPTKEVTDVITEEDIKF